MPDESPLQNYLQGPRLVEKVRALLAERLKLPPEELAAGT